MTIKQIIVAVVVACCALSASATTEGDLQHTWNNAFPTNHPNDMAGTVQWISVTFSTNGVVNWKWEREGKVEAKTGHYFVRADSDGNSGQRKRFSVFIMPRDLPLGRPLVLKDVVVDKDNRFPVDWTALKCQDARGNRLVFLRERHHRKWRTSR